MAASYLKEWLLQHPAYDIERGEIDPSELVFVRVKGKDAGKPMTYQMFHKIIKTAAKRAGVRKRVYPHILRHTRATVLANHLTEQQMNVFFGWVQGSDMPSVYVHLSGRDIENAVKKIYGLQEEEEEKILKPAKCPRCGEINVPQAKFCHKCGLLLDEKMRLKLQLEESRVLPELMMSILNNPERLEKFKILLRLVELMENDPKKIEKVALLFDEIMI